MKKIFLWPISTAVLVVGLLSNVHSAESEFWRDLHQYAQYQRNLLYNQENTLRSPEDYYCLNTSNCNQIDERMHHDFSTSDDSGEIYTQNETYYTQEIIPHEEEYYTESGYLHSGYSLDQPSDYALSTQVYTYEHVGSHSYGSERQYFQEFYRY